MNRVEPITDPKKIQELKKYLQDWNEKYYMMWLLGTNMGLRISQILAIRVRDIRGKDRIIFRDEEIGSKKWFPVNRHLKREVQDFITRNNLEANDYLIRSNKGANQPLSRVQAYAILNRAARECGIDQRVGTHTMRKTFGYWHYRQHKDVAMLQQLFGHSSPSTTLKYIGLDGDEILDKSLEDFYI